ncbi:MAG TPA: hypothetical protein VFV31_03310, partial [Chitinophagaceae bacterium]|nr:hypothetical protein [Chitinophagaceae bacterium]
MRKLFFSLAGGMFLHAATAQNPATVFTIANRNITLPCGTGCTSISAKVPHIKQTNNYVITNPAYIPFAYTTAAGNIPTEIYIDDRWSNIINPGFSFCYYGNNF